MRTVAYAAFIAYLPIGLYIALHRDEPNAQVVRFGMALLLVSLVAAFAEVT
jgi:hypothetical protein